MKNIIISEKENSYIIIKKNAWSYDDKIEKNFNDLQKEHDTFSLLESSILQEKVFGMLHRFIYQEYSEMDSSKYES